MKKYFNLSYFLFTFLLIASMNIATYASNVDQNVLKQKTNATTMLLTDDDNQLVSQGTVDFELKDASRTKENINFRGEIGGKSYDIVGKLYSAENGYNLIVGDLSDRNNNFEIIYFGVTNRPQEALVLSKGTSDGLLQNGYIGFLYVRDTADNKMYFIELNPSLLIAENDFNNLLLELTPCEHELQFWYTKILKPSAVDVYTTSNDEKILESSSKIISLRSVSSENYDKEYVFSYNVGGALVKESFTVRHSITGPDVMWGQGNFDSKLMVLNERTTCSSVPSLNSNQTNMVIGSYSDSRIDTVVSKGDFLQNVKWSSSHLKPGSFNAQLGWSYSIPTVNLGISLNYDNAKYINQSVFMSFDNTNNKHVRNSGLIWNNRDFNLVDVGHCFDTSYLVSHYSLPGTKVFKVQFNYYVSNRQNYTYGGMNSEVLTKTYLVKS